MISRGIAAFLGGFTLLNLLGELFAPGFDANIWWIDFSPLPRALGNVILFVGGLALVAHAAWPVKGRLTRGVVVAPIAILAMAALDNAARFYLVLHRHLIRTSIPLPFSALVFAALIFIGWRVLRPATLKMGRGRLVMAGTLVACLGVFPAAQMFFFGHTDYRRKADVIVVFGARAHADGSPSSVLADRVSTACALYRDGMADAIVFSGGPGDGAIDEPHAMRKLALQLGVPDSAIHLDPGGLNTGDTVADTDVIFRELHAHRVLAVSHFYHLPRIKLAYCQAGWDVYTVPAVQHYRLPGAGRFLMAREMVALGAYYLHPFRH
ncbi:MAG TPA: YdcF family protein [Tepidisphaeraceae bacterium]|jgi:vancomycin permeability regulator SanA|nr:YdcF family protein [Tepidisphaeraceae bacterium]